MDESNSGTDDDDDESDDDDDEGDRHHSQDQELALVHRQAEEITRGLEHREGQDPGDRSLLVTAFPVKRGEEDGEEAGEAGETPDPEVEDRLVLLRPIR